MRTASPDQISDLLRAFDAVTWPAGRQAARDLAAALGWSVRLETPNGIRFVTNLGTNDDRARALVITDETAGDVLDELEINVSDAEDQSPTALQKAYTNLCTAVEAMLGPPVVADRGNNPRTFWDLTNGGRVGLQRLDDIVGMVLLSRDAADLARQEARLGISPDRVPGTGHEDL